MGFTPRQVDQMSMWEFLACLDGYAEANSGEARKDRGDGMGEDRMRDLGIEGF